LGDFAAFVEDIFGIDTVTPVPAGQPVPGVTIAGGVLSIRSNLGTANGISLSGNNLIVNRNTSPATPLGFENVEEATGESTITTFAAFDSLGNPLQINLVTVLVGQDENGTQWELFATTWPMR